jgi:hypothetical protein
MLPQGGAQTFEVCFFKVKLTLINANIEIII